MTTLELKSRILIEVASIQDVNLLEKALDILRRLKEHPDLDLEEFDDWDEGMSPELEADLARALIETENPENLISDEDARKMFAQWL